MSQLLELVPPTSPTVADADDSVVACIALWLAEVSADAALAAGDPADPIAEQPVPE